MNALNELNDGDNIGGLADIEVALANDFESFNPVSFKSGKYWKGIDFHPMSGLLKEDLQDSDHGIFYSYAGSFKIPKRDKKTELILDRFVGQLSVWRITDLNGLTIVIGSPSMPVTLTRSSDTGSSPAEMNHSAYSFIVSQPYRALWTK